MKIEFSKEDVERILFDSFCNGGLVELYHCSIQIDWESNPNSINYTNAKNRLIKREFNICREDVLIEILKNGDAIIFTDYEGDEEETLLMLDTALENINSIAYEDKIELAKLLDEDNCEADAWDYFNAIRYCLYKEVIYG